jgi:ribosomal protein S18 acetylase RimI-like enzyme
MAAEIAEMRAQDEAAFLELTRAFYAHERFDFDPAASGRMVRHLLANPQVGAVYLAWLDGQAVGYLVLTRCYSLEFGGPFVLLDEIFVLPEERGTGLGRRLLDTAAQYCREAGAAYLRLEVQKQNTRSVEIYRARGFRTEDRFLMSLPIAGEKSGAKR